MIRTIVKSENNILTLRLPDDLVGKMIEIIAFPIDGYNAADQVQDQSGAITDFKKKLKSFSFNSGGYQFNRDEANDYE